MMNKTLLRTLGGALLLSVALGASAPAAAQSAIGNAIRAYNDGEFSKAAFGFYEVAAYDPILENRLKSEFFLAESLRKQGLLRTSAFFYQAVMSQGPNHPYYLKSIAELVEIIQAIRDDLFLPLAISQEYGPEFAKLDPQVLYKINYLVALTEFRRENAANALSYLSGVPRESQYYAKSLYLGGIIQTFEGRAGAAKAIAQYEEILELADSEALSYWDLANTKELATLALARTHYTLGNYPESKAWFEKVERYSKYWDVSLSENGWAAFMAGDIGTAMGSLHSLHAPQFSGSFQPESLILKALVYHNSCLYEEAKGELATFDAIYKPMIDQLGGIRAAHASDADLGFYLALVARPGDQDEKLPLSVRNFFLDNQRVKSLIGYLNLLEDEIEVVSGLELWKGSSLQRESLTQLEQQLDNNVKVTGRFIRSQMGRIVGTVQDFDGKAEILRFEVSKAEKTLLEQGVDLQTRLVGQRLLRPEIPGEQWEYWSFAGEWWVDELGYYKYTLKSACETQGGAAREYAQ